jgi:predicted ATPase
LFHEIVGALEEARKLAQEILDLAERSQDPSLVSKAHGPMGETRYWCGELKQSLVHLHQASDLENPQKHRPATLGGEDLQRLVANRSYQANALWNLGYSDQALRASRTTVALAQQLARPGAMALALLWNAGLHQLLRESQTALERADALIALSTEHGFPQYMVFGMLTRGRALAELGQPEEGISQMRAALDATGAAGAELARPYYLAVLAETYGQVGQPDEGLALAAEALEVLNRTGQRLFASYAHRIKGNLLLALSEDRHAEAEECLRSAIDIARPQANRRSELWAATSLARLWKDKGKVEEARELLGGIYGWYTEGFDFQDLKEAKALLDEMK